MKKFMVMLLMMVMASFASPLFALDESPPGIGCYSINAGEMIYNKNRLDLVGAAHADDVAFVKVDILHKDTLMYSWGECDKDNRIGGSGGHKQNTNLASVTAAVVCYPHGVVGA